MVGFEEVWGRIEHHAGEEFHQIRGKTFRYEIQSGTLIPDTTNRNLAKSQFEKAFSLVPLDSTVPVQHLQGPSYLYAILMDARIRRDDW